MRKRKVGILSDIDNRWHLEEVEILMDDSATALLYNEVNGVTDPEACCEGREAGQRAGKAVKQRQGKKHLQLAFFAPLTKQSNLLLIFMLLECQHCRISLVYFLHTGAIGCIRISHIFSVNNQKTHHFTISHQLIQYLEHILSIFIQNEIHNSRMN